MKNSITSSSQTQLPAHLQQLPQIFEALQKTSSSPSMFRKGIAVLNGNRKLFLKLMVGLMICFALTMLIFGIFCTVYMNVMHEGLKTWFETGKWSDWNGYLAWMDSIENGARMMGKWIVIILVFLFMGYAAWKVAFLFMLYWTDEMVIAVKKQYRSLPDLPFSMARWLILLKTGGLMALRNLVFVSFFTLLGLIPVIGIIFTGLGIAWSSGADIYQTVLMVYTEEDLDLPTKVKMQKRNYFRLGIAQSAFFFAPFINFLLVPFGYIVHVIGFTAQIEETMQALNSTQSEEV